MKVRSYMISRYAELRKTKAVLSIKPADDAGKFDIEFADKVILRVNESELAALKLTVTE